jgi:hypothetical protein
MEVLGLASQFSDEERAKLEAEFKGANSKDTPAIYVSHEVVSPWFFNKKIHDTLYDIKEFFSDSFLSKMFNVPRSTATSFWRS